MKITKVTGFHFPDGTRVEFVPIKDTPGFTHRVWIIGKGFTLIAKDWFSPVNGKLSAKFAQFYYEKHCINVIKIQTRVDMATATT